MFTGLVSTLTLDKIPLTFIPMNDGSIILDNTLIEDVMQPVARGTDSVFIPDFSLSGYLLESKYKAPDFVITDLSSATHKLFITGVPKETEIYYKFKMHPVDFISYWEDSKIGYLTQIIRVKQL